MLNRIKMELLNFGLKFMSIDEKLVRMILETKPYNIKEIVILPAIKLVTKKIVNKLKNKRLNGRVYNGILNGVNVSVIRSLIGCPNAALVLECLKRCNNKIIIRIDLCGAITLKDNPINVGDILMPKIAYCGDGTSPNYIIKHPELLSQLKSIKSPIQKVHELKLGNSKIFSAEPDEKLTNLLFNQAKSIVYNKVKKVDFWTTDAMFCETPDFINSLKSIGINGIDMESSIIFLLGILYNLKVTSILSVSDLPGHPKYDLFNSNAIDPNMENGINKAIEILIKALPKIKKEFL
ncbi:MAG: phosphorylase family protein [Promethearchaeota archaeon]